MDDSTTPGGGGDAPFDAGNSGQWPPADQPAPEGGQEPTPGDPDNSQDQYQPADDNDTITWTASEFIAHQKSAAWYGRLALVTVLVAGIIFLITRDLIATSAVVFCAILFGVAAGRQPRQLEYRVDNDGVKIGAKEFGYETFRSFSIVPEGAFSSIVFMPMKRFAPVTTIYFAPEDEPRIVGLLSGWLPMQEYQHDVVERLMHHIRF